MSQQHSLPWSLIVSRAALLIWTSTVVVSKNPAPAVAEDVAELSLSTTSVSQSVQEPSPKPPELFLRTEFDLISGLPTSTWSPAEPTKEAVKSESSTRQSTSPSLSWEKHEQTGESFLINIRPHFTKEAIETARSPVDRGESYQKSPLNSDDLIYGLGVATDYELAPWLHFNSSFRFNMHNARSNPGSSAASPGDSTSHSLFFGVTVPFSASPDE